jgi:hypothetical protein
MLDTTFSIVRVAQIIRNDIYERRRELLLNGAVALTTYFGYQLVLWHGTGGAVPSFDRIFTLFLWTFGVAITSGSFKSSADLRNGSFFLSLPASVFEKFIARWLLTGPLYILAFTLLIYLSNILLYPILVLVFKRPVPFLPIIPLTIMESIAVYYVLHSVMLCGSVLFRRNHFGMTMASIGGAFFILGIVCTPLFGREASLVFTFNGFAFNAEYSEAVRHRVHLAGGIFFYGILMPLLWSSTYLLFREKEL